jgi:hypothetical protein
VAGLQQTECVFVKSVADIRACPCLLPAYIKTPIGTASVGVQFAATDANLQNAERRHVHIGSFDGKGQLLVHRAV